MKSLRIALLALALAAGAAAAQIVPAARVNGVAIPLERLDRQYEELLRERRIHPARMTDPKQAKALKREALDQLIRVELLAQEGTSAGIVVDDDAVDKAVAGFRSGFRTADAYRRRLEQLGYDEPGWRAQMRKLLVAERYADRIAEREVKIDDKDIADFYDLNARLFKREEQLRVRQILVAMPADADGNARERAKARVDELVARLAAGESFEELARRHSDDPTRQWGGEMDPFGRGVNPRPFEDAAFALKPGEVSRPVLTPRGWHLIRLEERTAAQAVPLDEVREKVRDWLRRSRGKDAVDREVQALRGVGDVQVLTPL
jgi:parvulin-like peptidyl-prolyl isomerase